MRIAEIFYSIQGEGELTGVPSVFVRISGCNLRCRWCDTPYASWKPEGEVLDADAVFERVTAFAGARHVVITGGEPMLAGDLPELSLRLQTAGWHITIETAGTVSPGRVAYDLASISPKLADSTPSLEEAGEAWVRRHEATRLQPDVIREWLNGGRYQLKFVVGSKTELGEIQDFIAGLGLEIPAWKILLMPEGTESGTVRSRGMEVAEWCKSLGYRFCDRLHVHLYGNTKGT